MTLKIECSAHPNYVKISGKTHLHSNVEQKNVLNFSRDKIHTFSKKGCNFLAFKNIYAMYKSKYHSVLRKYTSGFRKHKSNIDMANNYVLLSRFH